MSFGETPAGVTAPAPFLDPEGPLNDTLDLTSDEYHADAIYHDRPTLSASIAHTLVTASPWHAWAEHPRLNPRFERADEDRFDLGTAVHALLIEGEEIVSLVDADSWRTKDAKEARERARAAGKVPMLVAQWERVQQMVEATHSQLAAMNLEPRPFTGGDPEVTLVFELDGVLCRCRIDWLHAGATHVSDFKSTGASAHPAAWAKTALGIGADIQVALYTAGVKIVHGVVPAWRYIVQETYPPYALSIVEPDSEFHALGLDKLMAALKLWRECLASGVWPGYPQGVHRLSPPGWATAQWLENGAAA